ncbi:hypothetical protein [Nonomuraea salmonea]
MSTSQASSSGNASRPPAASSAFVARNASNERPSRARSALTDLTSQPRAP